MTMRLEKATMQRFRTRESRAYNDTESTNESQCDSVHATHSTSRKRQPMAENKSTQVSTNSTNGTCTVANCILHLEGETTSDKKVYKFRVHFKSQKEVQAHALESMCRVVAQKARSGKAIPIRENGSHVDIDHTGGFSDTIEDQLERIGKMSPEELVAAEKYYRQLFQATQKVQPVAAKS